MFKKIHVVLLFFILKNVHFLFNNLLVSIEKVNALNELNNLIFVLYYIKFFFMTLFEQILDTPLVVPPSLIGQPSCGLN